MYDLMLPSFIYASLNRTLKLLYQGNHSSTVDMLCCKIISLDETSNQCDVDFILLFI